MELFSDVNKFREHILPVLKEDTLLNTICLSELSSIDNGTTGTLLGSVTCSACPTPHTCAALSAGPRGVRNRIVVSSSVCSNVAEALAQQLDTLNSTSITAPSAAAKHILAACHWDHKYTMNLMELNIPRSTLTANPSPASTATSSQPAASTMPAPDPAATSNNLIRSASATASAPCTPRPLPEVHLRHLSRDSSEDMNFIMKWCSDFLQEAMNIPSPPSSSQVEAMVLPCASHGHYSVAVAALQEAAAVATAAVAAPEAAAMPLVAPAVATPAEAAAADADQQSAAGLMDGQQHPVTLLCHVPTSSSSTRIVQVFTPHQFRRKGYARAAGERTL